MASVTAEASLTLPEGATLRLEKQSIARSGGGLTIRTVLRAWRGKNEIHMTVDDISPSQLEQYLRLCVNEINRHRKQLATKPGMIPQRMESIKDFVRVMAFNDMFIFEALTNGGTGEPNKQSVVEGVNGVEATGKKTRRKRVSKNHKPSAG